MWIIHDGFITNPCTKIPAYESAEYYFCSYYSTSLLNFNRIIDENDLQMYLPITSIKYLQTNLLITSFTSLHRCIDKGKIERSKSADQSADCNDICQGHHLVSELTVPAEESTSLIIIVIV